ncbi:MAG: dihydrolipoyl dehydrogenase [Thermoplasmata archaeon]|nr:MAG: dihydrolipoyl dehydrogenase [Thermoplasmata archaeon]
METFDLIVIGSGAGMNVASNAVNSGMRVAVCEHYLMGGTCLNNGCIPSKILLYPADVIRKMGDAADLGIKGRVEAVDFAYIMNRMREFVREDRVGMERGVQSVDTLVWFRDTAEFVEDYAVKVGKKTITAPKIIIASGSRTLIPAIPGLKETGYLDNISVLELKQLPKSIIIMGGGYIACEYGHFFSALGTQVTVIGRNPRLLKREDPDISDVVKKRFSKFAKIYTNYEAVRVEKEGDQKAVLAKNRADNKVYKFKAEEIMVAIGRRSNADYLKPEKTGVETHRGGWIKVDEYLETTKPGIWALGDALGKHMFRHTANYESGIVWRNAFTEHKAATDYHAVPHAVFGYPQVGAVGLTEPAARQAGYAVMVGKARYTDVAKGFAMGEDWGLAKVIVEAESRRILGAHILGSEASDLVQQIVYLMNAGNQDYMPLVDSQIIHPALSEVVINAFANLTMPGHEHGHGHQHEHQNAQRQKGRGGHGHQHEH